MEIFRLALRWFLLQIVAIFAKGISVFQKYHYASLGPRCKISNKQYIPLQLDTAESIIGPGLKIISLKNKKNIQSRFTFYYQPADEPRLKTLRLKYKLDTLVASAKNELESIIMLRNWTRSRFKDDEYQPMGEYFNGLEILDRNRHDIHTFIPGKTYSVCHTLSFLYTQVLLSMGFQARTVSVLERDFDDKKMHCVTELWSDLFGKWILMDTFLNLYYEKDGIPLNTLELHNARYRGLENIRVIKGIEDNNEREFLLAELLEFYTYFRVEFRNDWMTNHYFKGHPKRSDRVSVWWLDKNFPVKYSLSPKTDNHDDLYWPLNQVEISAKKIASKATNLELLFKTITPNFRNFEILIDDVIKIELKDAKFCWNLHFGENKLEVFAVNDYQRKGVPSKIILEKK